MKEDFNNYKLCFVDDLDGIGTFRMIFSKEDISEVWGDDWNDAPYEHNAGYPYEETISNVKNDYISIIISTRGCFSDLLVPCSGTYNSNFSIEDINIRQMIPWLRNNKINIYAGESLKKSLDKLNTIDDIDLYFESRMIGK